GRDDALGARELIRARRVGAVDRADLVRVDAQPALESAAAASLQRALERLGLLEVKPRAVDRTLQPRSARREDNPRARLGELGFLEADRETQLVRVVGGAE